MPPTPRVGKGPMKRQAMTFRTAPRKPDLQEMEVHACEAARLLKAMANEHRLLILCHLAEGELSVGDLNRRMDLSQSSLSQHLAVLRQMGLVETRREAQTVYYRLAAGPAVEIMHTLYGVYCAPGQPREN